MTAPGCRLRSRNSGFTFVGLLFWVAVTGVALAALGQVWSTTAQRERERELLFVGAQFRDAIGRYYEQSPGVKQYPRTLDDLLEDKRVPVVRRHLRKIYLDPITSKADWTVIKQGDQILGVFSPSQDKPLKSANFGLADSTFEEAAAYSDWRFVYTPAGVPGAGTTAPGAGTTAPGAGTTLPGAGNAAPGADRRIPGAAPPGSSPGTAAADTPR